MKTTPPPPPDVWWELRSYREKDGHTLTSLAAVTVLNGKPMSLSYLSDLENGRRRPNPKVTKALALALKVPTSVLAKPLTREEDAW